MFNRWTVVIGFLGVILAFVFYVAYVGLDEFVDIGGTSYASEEGLGVDVKTSSESVVDGEFVDKQSPSTVTKTDKNSDKLNVLIMGVDSKDLKGRTDTLVLLSLDKKNDELQILSIPRDSYVDIIGKSKKDKINHAFAFGQEDMTIATVENLLGIPIDHFAVLNFDSFIDTVDLLGGVTVDVPFDFTTKSYMSETGYYSFVEGEVTLDGKEALAYARMRKQDVKCDIGRGERHQQIIKSVMNEMTDLSNITKARELYTIVSDNIVTDVGVTDLVGLLPFAKSYGTTVSHTLSGEGMKLNGIYYYQLNEGSLNEVRTALSK